MDNIIPYSDYLYIEPLEIKEVAVGDRKRLERIGRVVSVGKDVVDTKIGDHVGFEEWDLKEFSSHDKEYKFIRERDAICKISL